MNVRFAVNAVIPVLMLLSGLSVITMQYVVSYRFDRQTTQEVASQHVKLVSLRLIQFANGQLAPSSLKNFSDELRSMKDMIGDLELAIVVDESNIILASTDPQLVERPLVDLPDLSQVASQIVRNNRNAGMLIEIGNENLLHGMFPVNSDDSSGLGEHSEIALVGIVLNQQAMMQIMQEKRLAITTFSGLILAFMTVLLWFLMSRCLVLPLQKLIYTVRSFARGDFTISANLSQENEIGEISLLLDSLATINKDREKAEASRNRLAQIVEESVSEIYVADADSYKILNANRAARKNLGYSLEECQTLRPWDFVESMTEQNLEQLIGPLRHGDIAFFEFETVQRRKNGSTYPVRAVLQFMSTQTPPVYTAIVQDITELRNHEQNFKLRDRAIEELDVGVSIIDATTPERPIVYVNRRLCEMSGYAVEELLGTGPEILRDEKHNSDELRKMYVSIAKGESVQGTLTFQRRDDTNYIGDVSLSPVHSAEGELTHYIAIIQDITARLETEAQLNRSQKIEAIGQLAGGVAHDFNNLLSVIIGNIEFLKQSVADQQQHHLLNQADMAAQMGARLTRKLLSFAKQDQLDPVVLDANEQVRQAMTMLRTTIGNDCHLTFASAGDLWRIRADPSGIENAVINLTLNARDAMPEGGRILIETSNVSFKGSDVDNSYGVMPGDYIQLSVSDTGHGMTREIKERIFEPFFTTKDVSENTGLGLASTYGFAQQSGGSVLVDSDAGSGAVISLLLPRHDESSDIELPTSHADVCLAMEIRRILVVEDDVMVRDVTLERLHILGYHTTQAANGPEAISLLQLDVSFDLVLTDLVMDGGMSGYDVADWIQLHHPECKVLLTSGYSEEKVHDGRPMLDVLPLLQKPYKMADLQAAINDVLDGVDA